ncbi:MAG: protein kinase [Thermoguttaceae bacterium]
MNTPCSVELLESALAGELPPEREELLHRHLKECETCATALEQMAGGEAGCREAAAMFKSDELDDALSARTEWSDVDFTVEHLEPSDEPGVLGRLGGYDVLEIIGRGGMGVVLKGFDPELKRCVAIKVLSPHLAQNSLAKKRFAREAQAAAAIVHPNVLAIHQVQPGGRLPFLVMPLVAGESLAQRLTAQGRLELKETLRIGMQAAAGLAAAHEQGLVHRDVKPANILLEKGVERAVLTDFGLARAADDVSMTRWGIIAGTPQYMSPEQARGEPLDGRSDLFSLGCVLYEMATGVSPFRTDSVMATMRRLVDDSPQAMASLNPELPPWFIAIVERLLEKDPSRRFNSAKEVSELLEGCLAHVQQPSSVPLPAALPKSARKVAGTIRVPSALRRLWRPPVVRFKGVVAMLAALGVGLLGMLLLSAAPPDIAGQWSGEDWGQVVLKKTSDAEYTGTYSETVGKQPGGIQLKWSRIERRFNGTWREGEDRFGELSLRVTGDEIRGALTVDPKSKITPATPRLADLTWIKASAVSSTEGESPNELNKILTAFPHGIWNKPISHYARNRRPGAGFAFMSLGNPEEDAWVDPLKLGLPASASGEQVAAKTGKGDLYAPDLDHLVPVRGTRLAPLNSRKLSENDLPADQRTMRKALPYTSRREIADAVAAYDDAHPADKSVRLEYGGRYGALAADGTLVLMTAFGQGDAKSVQFIPVGKVALPSATKASFGPVIERVTVTGNKVVIEGKAPAHAWIHFYAGDNRNNGWGNGFLKATRFTTSLEMGPQGLSCRVEPEYCKPSRSLTLDGVKQIGTAALSEGQLVFRAGQPQVGRDGTCSVTIGQWTARSGETTPIRVAVSPPRQSATGTVPEAVEKAVKTISTCAEGDPRVSEAMESLLQLNPADVVGNLCKFLDSQEATVRRAAIYILWQVKFASIAPAVPRLLGLCAHQEDLTRGMAALALGGNRVASSLAVLTKMTTDDRSGYARRCAAIALGFLGNPAATGVLEKALKDPEALVQANAQAALKMLRQAAAEKAPSQATFGPVIERTLNPTDRQHDRFLDLDTGTLYDAPSPQEVNPGNVADVRAWAAKKGIDLLAEDVPVGIDLAIFPRPDSREWDQLPAAGLLDVMAQATGATPAVLMPGKELPATFYFKTREGHVGVLQIVGFVDDKKPGEPRGIKIRYKLVVPAGSPPAEKPKATFGPVIERVLPSGVVCRQQYFQFRSGEVFIVGRGPITTKEEAEEDWKKVEDAGGVDMFAWSDKERIEITGKGCIFTQDRYSRYGVSWEKTAAEEAAHKMKLVSDSHGVVEPKTKELPVSYLFKTSRGEVGILQVIGAVEDERGSNGRGMKFRYKLVQGGAPETAAGQNLSFGPVVNGLQAAVELKPASGTFRLGEPIGVVFHIRNRSTNGVYVAGLSWRQNDNLTIEDDQGRKVDVEHILSTGEPAILRAIVQPGDKAVFNSGSLEFLAEDANDKEAASPVAYYVKVKPGKFTIRFGLNFPDIKGGPDESYPLDWRGDLETAPVTVDVKAPAAPVAAQQPSFGPVIERVVNDPQATREKCALNLDSGELTALPAAITLKTRTDSPELREAMAWARSNHIDAVATVTMDKEKPIKGGVLGLDLPAIPVANDVWDQITTTQLAEQLKGRLSGWGFIPQVADLVTDGKFPATYLFQTRAGRMGILQVTGFTDNPRGVKIRYKLVQPPAKSRMASAPTVLAEICLIEMPSGLPVDLAKLDLAAIQKKPGVEILSAPKVITASGRDCEIKCVSGTAADALAPAPTGVTAHLRPTLDGETVHYAVKLSISLRQPPGQDERTTVQELAHSGDARLDQPVVIDVGKGDKGRRLLAWMVFHRVKDAKAAQSRPEQAGVMRTASDSLLQFGPVIERVLPSGVDCQQQYFQFQNGRTFMVGHGPDTTQEEFEKDRQKVEYAGGADMTVTFTDEGTRLVGKGCVFTQDVHDLKWDSLAAEEVVKAMKHVRSSYGVVEPRTKDFPATYLFKTSRGALGILQIIGVVEDWRGQPDSNDKGHGMKFRYKLVQDPARSLSSSLRRTFDVYPAASVYTIACSPDGRTLAVAGGAGVGSLLDAKTGRTIRTLKLFSKEEETLLLRNETVQEADAAVMTLAFSPDSRVLAAGSRLGQVKLFDLATGDFLRSLGDASKKSGDGNANEKLPRPPRALGHVASLAFSPGGSLLATGGTPIPDPSTIPQGSDLTTRPGNLRVWDVASGAPRHELVGHAEVVAVAFSPDGKWLASEGLWSPSHADYHSGVKLWDAQTWQMKRMIQIRSSGYPQSLAFASDSLRIAVGYLRYREDRDLSSGMIHVAHVDSGNEDFAWPVDDIVGPVAFSPDGKFIAARSAKNAVTLWDSNTGKPQGEIRQSESFRTQCWFSLAFLPQGNALFIGGTDREKGGFVGRWDWWGDSAASGSRPSTDDYPAWLLRFQAAYRLNDGELVRHIRPPYLPERTQYCLNEGTSRHLALQVPPCLPNYITFHQNDKGVRQWGCGFGGSHKHTLRGALQDVSRLMRYEIQGPDDLLKLALEGDWTVREGVNTKALLGALQKTLRSETKRNIHFEQRAVQREVIVARGRAKAGAGSSKSILIYAEDSSDDGAGGGSGDMGEFLANVGDLLGIPLVNELKGDEAQAHDEPQRISWEYHRDADYARMGQRRDELTGKVLKNLATQTGLSFSREQRSVEIWFVSEQQ